MVRAMTAALLALAALTLVASGASGGPPQQAPSGGLTDVQGIKVGHFTLDERPTGCTVILTEDGAVGAVDVRGGAPGTRETDLLNPVNTVQEVHGIVLSGGSAFGLAAAQGTVRYLEERGIGYPTGSGPVPIVPAAILFDLGMGDKPHVRPTEACGYEAALRASAAPVEEGSIGAGAGATVGKMGGSGRSMKSGIGSASITLPNGLTVAALVAVNAVGDVIDPATGQVVAGVRTEDGKALADVRTLLRSGALMRPRSSGRENTTIGVVATNAVLNQAQATKVAQMAHDGYARAISPVHTPADGDVIFALATGEVEDVANVMVIGALAAEVMADAIVRAARQATSAGGVPALRDLPGLQ